MKTPEPTWETDYRHDRREHRHRCRCCNRILNEGDRAIMTRLSHRKTVAAHIACADKEHTPGLWLWRDAFMAWGIEYLRAVGYRIERHPMSFVPGTQLQPITQGIPT